MVYESVLSFYPRHPDFWEKKSELNNVFQFNIEIARKDGKSLTF